MGFIWRGIYIPFQWVTVSLSFMWGSREGDRGFGLPLENYKNIGFLSNTGPDTLKITKLPIQHSMLGHHRPTNETPFNGVLLAGQWWPVNSGIWILPPLIKLKKKCCQSWIPSDKQFWISTCLWCIQNLFWPKLEYEAPIWSPNSKLQNNQVEKVQRTATRWTCRRWRNTSSVGNMLDELEWPSLEALLLFHKIHCDAVSVEKDKYLTPAHSLKTTRSSQSTQYCK